MKQLIVLDKLLRKKDIIETDVVPRVFDCIAPQKATINLLPDVNVEESDIVVIRDGISRNEEYLGIIDIKEKNQTLRLSILPFISITDNELDIESLDGKTSVQEWIARQINNNFVDTTDVLSKYNIIVRNNTQNDIIYKAVSDTDNLMQVLNEIYLNTGIFVEFKLGYTEERADKIYCDIYNSNEMSAKKIKYDSPQIIDKVKYSFSQYGNYSKATIYTKTGAEGEQFLAKSEIYLRQDNELTTNPKDPLRIKKIKNKNITISTEEAEFHDTHAQQIVIMAQKALCGDAFAYSIEFTIHSNSIYDWKFRQRCDFYAEDKLYQSYITNIEYLNDKEAKITLGAYRYTLTDKFKNLLKVKKEIGSNLNGIEVNDTLSEKIYYFTQNEEGDLIFNCSDDPGYVHHYTLEDGNLMLNYISENSIPDISIREDGQLVYAY